MMEFIVPALNYMYKVLIWGTFARPLAWLYTRLLRWNPERESLGKKIRGYTLLSIYLTYTSVYFNFAFTHFRLINFYGNKLHFFLPGLTRQLRVVQRNNDLWCQQAWGYRFKMKRGKAVMDLKSKFQTAALPRYWILSFGPTGLILFLYCIWGEFRGYRDPFNIQFFRRVTNWSKKVGHERFLKTAKKKSVTYIGYSPDFKKPVYLTERERNAHVHVLGSTGSGKTRYVIFPMMKQDIEAGLGVVFIDAKGSLENAKAVYKMVCDAGRQEDYLFFSLTHPELSQSYNPLQNGNPTQLKDKIAGAIEWSEPFYQRVCEDGLQLLFMEFQEADQKVTLQELYKTLKNPPSRFRDYQEFADINKKNVTTLASEIGLMVNTPFSGLFNTMEPEIDFTQVYKKRKIVYFALDTQTYQSTAMRFGKMVTQDLNTLSGLIESRHKEEEKQPLAIYIDEFQAFGTKSFINALARGRSSKFWISIAHQSIGDLKAIGESYSSQVIENTNTKIFLRVNDPESAELFANSLGTQKTIEYTKQAHFEGEEPSNIMGSQRIVEEYKIHPSEIKELEVGQAVFKSPGQWGKLILNPYFDRVNEVTLPALVKDRNVIEYKPDIENEPEYVYGEIV